MIDRALPFVNYVGGLLAVAVGAKLADLIESRRPIDASDPLVLVGGGVAVVVATEIMRRRKHRHGKYAHGFVLLNCGTPAAAEKAQQVLGAYSRTTKWLGGVRRIADPAAKTFHIDSVDHLDESAPGKVTPSRHLLVEYSWNPHHLANQDAHDRIMALSTQIPGLANAPGAEKVWCCVSDM